MRVEKSNYNDSATLSKISAAPKATNIWDLIKKNKEERKDEVIKSYIILSTAGIILFLFIFFYFLF